MIDKEKDIKIDLTKFFSPVEKPVMLGEMPSINTPRCASELVICALPPRKSFSIAAVHAEIIERGFYVSLPQTMDEVYADFDSILSQQPLLPSLSDARKLVDCILPKHHIL